jgi:hypothetical protein
MATSMDHHTAAHPHFKNAKNWLIEMKVHLSVSRY